MSFPESLYGQKSLHSSVENWFSNAGHWSLNRGMFWIHKVIQSLIVQLCMERKKPVTSIYIEMGPGRTDSLEKTLMLGKIDGKRRSDDKGWDGWMASLTRCMRLSKLWELVMDRESCHAAVYGVFGHNWAMELNWDHLDIEDWEYNLYSHMHFMKYVTFKYLF